MVRQLLATTALVVGMSVAAWADDVTKQPGADATVPPAAAPQGDTTAAPQPATPPADTAAAPQTAAPQGDTAAAPQPAQGGDTTAVGRSTPAEAVITTQSDSATRAEELIGMGVVSAEGEEIGSVNDLIFDGQHKLTGIVVGVGGFLGIGEKEVGINWSQTEMRADADTGKQRLFVGLTKADLESAPDFKTKQQLKAEAEAAEAAAQSQSQMPAPAAGGGTTTQQ